MAAPPPAYLDVAEGAGVAIVPAAATPPPGVVLVALDPPVALPVVAAWRRWTARPVVKRFLAAAGGPLASPACPS